MRMSNRFSKPSQWFVGLGCVALLLAGGSSARADNIDKVLWTKAGKIMQDLEDHHYKNVGILKFQVKKGNTPPTLTAGKLNYLMATRLENALVMVDKPDAPIGLTRGASAVAAAKDPKATYLTLEGRRQLFATEYPLAWGTQNLAVDGFLTGIVEIAPDMQKTKIIIQAFDKENPDLREVLSFTVDTDMAILRDINQNFVVARRSFNTWAPTDDPDDKLNEIAVKDAVVKESQPDVAGKMSVEGMKEYLDFKILYDGQPVKITPNGFLNMPAVGQKVLIKVTAKVKLGLLLRVNGKNTLDSQSAEKSDLTQYGWWVLEEPGKEYVIRGFYNNGKVQAFKAKAADDVEFASDLGAKAERHGKIDIDIFVDPTALAKDATPKARKPDYTFRTVTTRAATFDQLKDEIRQGMPAQRMPAARNFIVGGATENQTLQTTAFDGRHIGGLTLNYRKEYDR
jgi:hypothetical protein